MPQASDSQRKLMNDWFGDPVSDAGPSKLLESRGFIFGDDGVIIPPVPHHNPTVEEVECILFLINEWDYGYDPAEGYRSD